MNTIKNQARRYGFALLGAAAVMAPVASHATTTDPVDLTSTAANLVTYVGDAAALGLTVFAAIYGVRILIKAFKTVAK